MSNLFQRQELEIAHAKKQSKNNLIVITVIMQNVSTLSNELQFDRILRNQFFISIERYSPRPEALYYILENVRREEKIRCNFVADPRELACIHILELRRRYPQLH